MRQRLIHRLIAVLLLTAYGVVGTSALPAVLAFVAAWDSSHQLVVRESKDGFEIALHHQSGCMTPDVSDHDSDIAKWLVSLSKPTQQGDHLVVCPDAITATTAHESLLKARVLKSAALENLYATLEQAFQHRMVSRQLLQAQPQVMRDPQIKHDLPTEAGFRMLI
jgi:hypothetical protein